MSYKQMTRSFTNIAVMKLTNSFALV